jgi:homoserine dehydrogenase
MNVAIFGFGTVGQSVAKLLLQKHADRLTLTHVFNRDIARKKVDWMPGEVVWTEDANEVFNARPDIVVELMGGVGPALDVARQALEAGASVVTANKQVIAHHGRDLTALARRHGAELRFEGSVAGGIPVLRAIEDGLSADSLVRVAGVVNGTSTHILSRMEEGRTFAEALSEAQDLGFAEADPSDDLTGRDAAAKLAILSATALNRPISPNDISCRSIASIEPIDFRYAGELQCTIRQVAWADSAAGKCHVAAAVRPALVSHRSPLARVTSNQNVVTVQGEFGGETAFYGRGAGGDATAVAVVSDLLAIVGQGSAVVQSVPAAAAFGAEASGPRRAAMRGFMCPQHEVTADYSAPHYVRFTVRDRPGIIAAVAEAFARQHISINAVLQHPGWPKDRLPFVMTLESCDEARLDRAVAEIDALDFHVQPPVVLPIFEGAV